MLNCFNAEPKLDWTISNPNRPISGNGAPGAIKLGTGKRCCYCSDWLPNIFVGNCWPPNRRLVFLGDD